MRIQRILVGAALLMLCAAAAYADVRISSVITAEVIDTGNAELVGDVELRVLEQAAIVADVITITYGGLPITIARALLMESKRIHSVLGPARFPLPLTTSMA